MEEDKTKRMRAVILTELYVCCAFCVAVSALPALFISYIVMRVSKHVWLKVLSSRYPHLQFVQTDTIRTLLDTHRNQGIINVLLCIKGSMNTEHIKQSLREHVLDRLDKYEQLMFPRLRHALVSCWGNYAWDAHIPFRLENHFLVSAGVYRGRPITDNNIQEYVSEIVSKYFQSEIPPWQYIVIPCHSTDEKYYILVRVHHLLLTGERSINIGDLLLVQQSNDSERTSLQDYSQQSPLTKLFPAPSAIPELWQKLGECLSNTWNEFVSEYDPVESPRALKSAPGVFHIAGLAIVAGACALRNLTKHGSAERSRRDHPAATASNLLYALRQECARRNITLKKVIMSPLVTVDPRKWPGRAARATITTLEGVITLPGRIRDEFAALSTLRQESYPDHIYPHTLVWQWGGLLVLVMKAFNEVWLGAYAAYRAPAQLWDDAVRAKNEKPHALQTASLCGRKVAAWSRPVSRVSIERTARALGVCTTDIALYATTEALRTYFEQTNSNPPNIILTTARAHTENFLFTFAEGNGKQYKKSQTGGMVCLPLPVGASPRRINVAVVEACASGAALAGAWAAQARCGALTRALPTPAARLALNVLSRRYAVSYAEINAPQEARPRNTVWGQELDHILYWRPPQANISMSLTLLQYADTVRIAVMADARLSPGHVIPTVTWPAIIEQIVS